MAKKFKESIWLKIFLLAIILIAWIVWLAPSDWIVKVGQTAQGETLKMGKASMIQIYSTYNNIDVKVSDDVSEIVARATGSGRSFDELKGTRIDGDTVRISMDNVNRWWQFWKIGLKSRRLEVLIPSSMKLDDLDIRSNSGRIDIGSFDNLDKIAVSSESGSISADSLGDGKVSVSTASGSMNISSITANEATLSSVSGRIELGHFESGKLNVSSSSGRLDVFDSGRFESVHMESSSGAIFFDAGAVVSPAISASTVSGSIEVNDEDFGSRFVLNDSGPGVSATSTSGSIEIKYGN